MPARIFISNPFLCICIAALFSRPAHTAEITSNFNVQVKVLPSCSFLGKPADIDLGSVIPGPARNTGKTTLNVVCTKKTKYVLALTPSNSDKGGTGSMAGSAGNEDKLTYALFQDDKYEKPWGNTTGASGNVLETDGSQTSLDKPVQHIIHTRLNAIGNVLPDTYRDAVTITLTY
ncbi:MAG: spore coat U domain-containing protein [Burkholderiaceae bacterium]|jgi:spore coat protein U-like protein|nr:spore coat U domain-containing protein [Burkholderiaceae bacterium]